MQWEFFKQKSEMRVFVLPKNPIRAGIWLPASQALCVRTAKEYGFVTNMTIPYLVEKQACFYQTMLKYTKDISNKIPFNSDLCNLRLCHQIDYAFLDLLGGITKRLALWMTNELSTKLACGSTVAITHMVAYRRNMFLPAQDSFLRTSLGSELRSTYGVFPKAFQRVLMIIHRIFRDWDFDIETQDGNIPTYRDSAITMMVIKLVNFRPNPIPVFPSIEEDKEMRASEVTIAIAEAETPAQKAVATRKLNKYLKEQEQLGHAKSRTAAAIKATVTRRLSVIGK